MIAGLARKGYTVGPAGSNKICLPGEVSSLVALSLTKTLQAEKDYSDLQLVLREIKDVCQSILYHSIVVEEGGRATWAGSNIKPPQPPSKTVYDKLNEADPDEPKSGV